MDPTQFRLHVLFFPLFWSYTKLSVRAIGGRLLRRAMGPPLLKELLSYPLF
ncbi:MAG: hypothetical protein AVDCRST_MAG93-904 [uncultured Chloroflexia bacterium]|uniref:Uncharacterized protein n=1 Tax=uncultured Chloroflexia bacterium TaxID=1672391 RepID=A0A6J4HUP8_9CHLR|nr:MAG: hypothetical protein AVDCRST_MAG93-904 [uncultured Chloroflexia bacterium]